MITNADITIFNKATGENRREVFIPTAISGVSWYDAHSVEVSKQQGMAPRDRAAKFIVRIPLDAKVQDGRTYLPEEQYKLLNEKERLRFWTIQLNSYIAKGTHADIGDLKQLTCSVGTVVEYADNTVRGSDRVKHWRIGGA